MRLACDRPGLLRFTARLSSPLHAGTRVDGEALVLRGRAPSHVEPNYENVADPVRYADDRGLHFEARLVIVTDGRVTGGADGLQVTDASHATLLVAMATSFAGPTRGGVTDGRDPAAVTTAQLASARAHTWDALRARQRDDHARLMSRVTIDLGASTPAAVSRPLDVRLADGPADDPTLATLLFQYGRYLLIACSRPGTQPANLQGLWNDQVRAPWSSNYTVNINTEMNYWPAEPANLAECHQPLLDDGRRTRHRLVRRPRASTTAPAAGRRTTTPTCGGRPRRSAASAKATRSGRRGRWAARGCRSTSGSTTRSAAMPPGCGRRRTR